MAYRLMRSFLRLVLSVFFRKIEVLGEHNIPKHGACIFAGNHPNSLMDPLLVITQCERPVHFAAKDVLFRSRFLRFFMSKLGAVPIKRRQDHQDNKGAKVENIDNSSAFEALFEILKEQKCMGIFPEGISHTGTELSRLKTGLARIAFGAKEDDSSLPLFVIPVGLTFFHRHRVRSKVLVHFGQAIELSQDWQEQFQAEAKDTVEKFTQEVDAALRGLTINAPDWETMKVMHTARRIYKPAGVKLSAFEYAELMRRFNDGYQRATEGHPVHALRCRLESYQDRLNGLKIKDHDLVRGLKRRSLLRKFLRRSISSFLLLPFAIPGMLLHAPIILLAIFAGDGLTKRKDVVATTKFISAFLFVPIFYIGMSLLVWSVSSWPIGLALFLCFPFMGLATIWFTEEQIALNKSMLSIWRLFRHHRELEDLKGFRDELEQELHVVVNALHDPSQERIFPEKMVGKNLPQTS